jgi:lysozyme
MPQTKKTLTQRAKYTLAAVAIATPLTAGFEGLRTVAYYDPIGIPTICFGETKGVRIGDKKTVEQCEDMLGDRLIGFAKELDKCLVRPIPDRSYAAVLSWTYNVGAGAACQSTLVKKGNAGDLVGMCNELPKWNKAGGAVLRGLTIRRAKEKDLCLAGVNQTPTPQSATKPAELSWFQKLVFWLTGRSA